MKRIGTLWLTVDRLRDILSDILGACVSVVALVTKPTGTCFEPMTFTYYAVVSSLSMLHEGDKVVTFDPTCVTIFSQTVNLLVP